MNPSDLLTAISRFLARLLRLGRMLVWRGVDGVRPMRWALLLDNRGAATVKIERLAADDDEVLAQGLTVAPAAAELIGVHGPGRLPQALRLRAGPLDAGPREHDVVIDGFVTEAERERLRDGHERRIVAHVVFGAHGAVTACWSTLPLDAHARPQPPQSQSQA